MLATPEIAVIVSTYQRPEHLRRCLLSLALQRGVEGRYEVVVVDDGSQDDTAEMVARIARDASFSLKFTTHPHNGFQLSRCRNAGVRNSTAPYLLFTDGDCIFPPDHLRQQLAARRRGVARAGHCIRLDEATSRRIDEAAIRSGAFQTWVPRRERRALRRHYWKLFFYQLCRSPEKPKLVGWNIALGREDVERINGFDELFRGWGCEDDDLRRRLRAQGVRIATSIGYTHGYHLWHPPHATAPSRWAEGVNVDYYHRPVVLDRCLVGLEHRSLEQLNVAIIAGERHASLARQLERAFPHRGGAPEIELLLSPGEFSFSAMHARRVVVVPAGEHVSSATERTADAMIRLAPSDGAPEIVRQLQALLGLPVAAASTLRRDAVA